MRRPHRTEADRVPGSTITDRHQPHPPTGTDTPPIPTPPDRRNRKPTTQQVQAPPRMSMQQRAVITRQQVNPRQSHNNPLRRASSRMAAARSQYDEPNSTPDTSSTEPLRTAASKSRSETPRKVSRTELVMTHHPQHEHEPAPQHPTAQENPQTLAHRAQ